MERKIGETFQFQGHNLRVVEGGRYQCEECFFYNLDCSSMMHVHGFCSEDYRKDKRNIIFVEAKDKPEKQQAEQPQKLNLCEILKNCPQGETFWSPLLGDVKFYNVNQRDNVIYVTTKALITWKINADGTITIDDITSEEVMLYPSREQRDWTKVKYEKKERFDPKTLKAFDRVIVRLDNMCQWRCDLFSNAYKYNRAINYLCTSGNCYKQCIPYNDDTKHLLGTTDEAPEFYRYWDVVEELDKTERGEGGYDHINVKYDINLI